MKKIFALLVCLMYFFALDAFATESKLINTLAKVKLLIADIKQTTNIEGVGKDEYRGSLYVIKGEKLLLEYTYPHRQFYLFTKQYLTHYDSLTNQLIKQKTENLGVENIVLRILFDPTSISNTFSIVVFDADTYKLYPKENLGLQYIQLHLKDGFIDEIISKDDASNITTIQISNPKLNKSFDESVFDIKTPANAEIFDY